MKFYQLVQKSGDDFTFNRERMMHLISTLFDGHYLISFQRIEPKSTVKDYRACYFSKIDTIAFELGSSRYEVHADVKEIILNRMIEETPELFTRDNASTKYLVLEGWGNLLERLDLWAFTEFNIVL
jgi:hypothetical protein